MKARKHFGMALVWLLLSCAGAFTAFAQSDRGTVTGTVKDPSGAVVSGAAVTATNASTGAVHTTTTSGEGDYTLSELPAGSYKITVAVAGFKTSNQNVTVAVQETRRLDFQLVVGIASESITVTPQAALQADSPVQQTFVTEKQVRELPLEVTAEFSGRTPLSFIFLDSSITSGTADSGSRTNASIFRVNGGQAMGTSILIDGASTQRAQNGTFFSEVAPGPDAFQEFTVSTSSYSAEFGGSSGGVVNFTLKSGGNAYHGETYDLLRNTALNANSFLNNANGLPRNLDHENDFGFNLGGPIWIPKLYKGTNRSFFFFNYEGYRFKRGENVLLTVPTAKMHTGDFSELLTDPYVLSFFNGPVLIYDPTIAPNQRTTPIPGNRLDLYTNPSTGKSVIDPVGQAILNHFPMPPAGTGVFHNYRASSLAPTDMNSYVAKLDQVITDKQRLSGSYTYRANVRIVGGFPRFPLPFIAQDVWHQIFKSHFARAQYDYTITPALVNHLNLAWSRADVTNQNTGFGHIPSVELGMPANATQDLAFPRAGFPGYGPVETSPDPRAAQNIGSTFFSDHLPDNTVEISDTATWVKGRHTFKFGGDIKWQQLNVLQYVDPGGTFNFRGDQTGSDVGPNGFAGGGGWPIASLLTGATEFSFINIHSVRPAWRYFAPAFFANDDIKVTPRLTLNVGARYEIPYPRTEAHNFMRGFDPAVPNPDPQIAGARLGALVGAGGQGGLQAKNRGLVNPDYSDFGPRVGFAYSLSNKSVVRGGIGLYYAPLLSSDIVSGLEGYNTSRLRTPNGRQSSAFLATYPAAPVPDPSGQFIGSDVDYFDPHFKLGRTVQYSLDYQRQLPSSFVMTLGYVGAHGTRLRSNFKRMNALPLNDLKLGFPMLTEPLANALANPAEVAYATSVGVSLPSSVAAVHPGFNGSVAQALRPFPQYGQIIQQLESQGTSLYNALQIKVDRRYTRGFQFGFSYNFSKLITNAAEDLFGRSPINNVVQNPFDIRSLRSVSPNNAAHVAVFNYLYELPFGRGRAYLSHSGLVNKFVGGWQINGIQRYQAGLPIVVLDSDNPFTSDFLNLVGYYSSIRPNLTGQPILTGKSPSGINFQLLNPAAFSLPPTFNNAAVTGTDVTQPKYQNYYADPTKFFGNAPPVISGVRALPFFSEDLSVMKRTPITERYIIELRAEFFNAFNRNGYFPPDGDLRDLGGGNFGKSGVGSLEPRVVQFGLKVIY
jgi:hypothetical protein